MTYPGRSRLAAILAATTLVLVAGGVAVASTRGGDGDKPRAPATVSVTTVATPAPTTPATTSVSRAATPATTAPPVVRVPEAPPVTLSYDPVTVPPYTAPPPTTIPRAGPPGLGCHESLVPMPECDVGPIIVGP